MKLIRTAVRLISYAAVAYTGYAAFTWLRYGQTKKKAAEPTLDRFLPDPEVVERNSIFVNAPPAFAYEACCNFDVMHSTVARMLFDTRAWVLGAQPAEPILPKSFVDQMKSIGWEVLEETDGQEIVFGIAAQPWLPSAGFRTVPAALFATFNDPGWVKIAFNVSVEEAPRGGSLVRTETRASTTNAEARQRFRNYWAFVSPGVTLIRIVSLRAIKATAEAAATAVAAA
ncbi:MAG TPA: hypothetical protein VL284_04535 [Thermoanaerobaculia bacterium]|nr:hypothetical protein [Thermoanaerobaculia bacterium]